MPANSVAMPHYSPAVWIGFLCLIFVLMAIDLGVLHRRAKVIGFREAVVLSIVWVLVALAFNVFVYLEWGHQKGLEFLTGYLIERSLSIDNLFVFLIIISYFRVPPERQYGVLMWGMLGAIILRGLFIFGGVALIHRFAWVLYVFGAFLVITGLKMAFHRDEEVHPERNPLLRLARRFLPITPDYVRGRFFVRVQGRIFATPLFIVILVIESTDVVFAVDSIPAIFGITQDPFIIFSSNVFAILGLRALYFALAGFVAMFHYLNYGLAAVLSFIGIKMLVTDLTIQGHSLHISTAASLLVVVALLTLAVIASILFPPKHLRIEAPTEMPPQGAADEDGEN
jgi:tellurite resistance protein TerC